MLPAGFVWTVTPGVQVKPEPCAALSRCADVLTHLQRLALSSGEMQLL